MRVIAFQLVFALTTPLAAQTQPTPLRGAGIGAGIGALVHAFAH